MGSDDATPEQDAPTAEPRPGALRRAAQSVVRAVGPAPILKFGAAGLVAVALGATAAFGGLTDAPKRVSDELPVLKADETHTNEQFALTFSRAVLIDDLPGSGTYPEEGERTLVVTATVTDVTNEPVLSPQYLDDTVAVEGLPAERIDDLGETAMSVVRLDDETLGPWLQPDLPVEVAISWPVPEDLLEKGETLRIRISDVPYYELQFLQDEGGFWDTDAAKPAAYVDLTLEDVGAGADQEEDG